MEHGKVAWFDAAKGFGRICLAGNSDTVFVHFSQIQMEGYKTLQQHEEVSFEIEQTPKGFAAVNVVPLRLAQAATK